MRLRIYILCFDDKTQESAVAEYGASEWAKILRIPTTPYMENIMYSDVLISIYDDWKDYDYVGTLSWKASKKVKLPDMDALAMKLDLLEPDVMPFLVRKDNLLEKADYYHPLFSKLWVQWLQQLGCTEQQARDPTIQPFYCNYWMAKTSWMCKYIEFFRIAKQVLETYAPMQDDLWSDSRYEGGYRDRCMAVYGKPYYPYHTFLCERLPCFFFWMHKVNMYHVGIKPNYNYKPHVEPPKFVGQQSLQSTYDSEAATKVDKQSLQPKVDSEAAALADSQTLQTPSANTATTKGQKPTIAVFYAYYEKSQEYIDNIKFFFDHGIYDDNSIDYYIIIHGECTLTCPEQDNVMILQRENSGFDFAGFAYGVKHLRKQYDYYAFVNSSCRGPFLPPYMKKTTKWMDPFIDLIDDNVKLVGSTINVVTKATIKPTIQTYMFMLDAIAFEYIKSQGFFDKIYYTMEEVIEHQEMELSSMILRNGWNISCLIPEYQKQDYKNMRRMFNVHAYRNFGDIVFPGKVCFGRDIHPYEVIFIKTSRGVSTDEIHSLTKALNTFNIFNWGPPSQPFGQCHGATL